MASKKSGGFCFSFSGIVDADVNDNTVLLSVFCLTGFMPPGVGLFWILVGFMSCSCRDCVIVCSGILPTERIRLLGFGKMPEKNG